MTSVPGRTRNVINLLHGTGCCKIYSICLPLISRSSYGGCTGRCIHSKNYRWPQPVLDNHNFGHGQCPLRGASNFLRNQPACFIRDSINGTPTKDDCWILRWAFLTVEKSSSSDCATSCNGSSRLPSKRIILAFCMRVSLNDGRMHGGFVSGGRRLPTSIYNGIRCPRRFSIGCDTPVRRRLFGFVRSRIFSIDCRSGTRCNGS